MRNVLTIIAVALVVVMSAALVAPMLIDWSAHRASIEARLKAISGANVSLTGPVELRLLPTPYLALGAGSLSAPDADGPRLSFDSARLELALLDLSSGRVRFSDISLDKPVLTVGRGADGALRLPALPVARLQSTGVDRLIVRDGRMRVAGVADRPASEIAGVEIDAAVPSLDGPARLTGQFSGPDGAPVVFRLASQKPGPEGTPLRVEVDAGPSWPASEFEGALEGDAARGLTGLRFAGAAILTGTAPGESEPMPWRVAGPMTLGPEGAALRAAEFRLGPEERAIRATGDATLAFGSLPRLSIALKAKQANVDSLMRRKGEDGVAPARAATLVSRIAAAALQGRQGWMAIDAKASAEPIILGAQTLPDATVALKTGPGAPLHLVFNVGLPGRSRIGGEGDLDIAAAKFRGDVDFGSSDFGLLREWASLGAPEAAAKVAAIAEALAYRSAALKGAVEASATGVSFSNLRLALDRTTLTGSLGFTSPAGGDAARLAVDLATDSLDVDTLPSLAVANMIGDADFSISLNAGSLHIARVGDAQIDSGSVALKAVKTGPNVTLERLSIAGLGGASLDMQGATDRDALSATGHLRADRLRDFAVLVSRLAPGGWSRILVDRADGLSPASLTFEAHGAAGGVSAPAIDSLRASGSAGETQFTVALDPRPKDGGRALTASLDSPNSGAMLRQLGMGGATSGGGRGHIAVNAAGGWAQGYDVDATSSLVGAELAWRGRFMPQAEGDDAKLFGAAKVKTPNLAPVAAALGLAPAGGGAFGPADIGFDATLRGDRWKFSKLAATIGGARASGELTYQPVATIAPAAQANAAISSAEEALGGGNGAVRPPLPPSAEIEGELAVDRLPMSDILALALGPPPQPGKVGTRWSEAKFAPAPLRAPSTAVTLKVGTLDLTDALSAHGFAAMLRLDKGRLDLDDLAMQIAGGAASGHATLRRDGDAATLTGSLTLDSVAVERPGFSGRLGGSIDFASTGRSPAALIDGLAGAGTVNFARAALSRSDPAALDRVVARAQAPDAPLDETNIAFGLGAELNRAPLPIPDGSAPIALNAGIMKVGPIGIAGRSGDGALSADLDLRKFIAGTRLTLASPVSGLKFWSGPPPSATVTVDNVLDAPKRQLDVSSLSAGLAAQAIARETDRIATMEADIRERAFFNRRLKGERFTDRRQQEIQDFEVEQARLKGLTEHLRAMEEAEKAAELEAAAKKAAAEKAAAEKAAADKAAADKAAADNNAEAVKPETPDGEAAAAAKAPFASAPTPKSDELGAAAPAPPMPPSRPKARSTPGDLAPGGLY